MKKKSIDHTQLLLLKLLSTEDMYGYQIILELARRSSNVFEMKEGTLYPVLHGMEREGYVEAYEKAAPTGRMRKYYHLTRAGRAALSGTGWLFCGGAACGLVYFLALFALGNDGVREVRAALRARREKPGPGALNAGQTHKNVLQ